MIKFNKDVIHALRTLEDRGIETYAVGDCVRWALAGERTYDWDFIAVCGVDQLKETFPEGKLIGSQKDTIRMDYSLEDENGSILDIQAVSGPVEEVLSARGFTVDAMADNPDKPFLDPYNGREDVKRKLVRTIGSAGELFKKDPIKMMDAVRIAAEMGYDLHKDVFQAISENSSLLLHYNIDEIRERLERILISANAGRGLSIMAESGLMSAVFGEKVAKRMNHTEMKDFSTLCDNIDKTHRVRLRRLGLLYTVLGKRKAFKAIERMGFDEKTDKYLHDAVEQIYAINFIGDFMRFKRFLFTFGEEEYSYLHNLSKAQRIVYDHPSHKIESRNFLYDSIKTNNEPVFIEDLVIDENDLMQAGIADTPERARELLGYTTSVVHYRPKNNDRDVLMKAAKKFSRSKFAVKTRYVKWMR